jgi:hypothetical protein
VGIENYEIYVDPVSKVVFAKTEKGTIPIGVNYNNETGNFESIEHIDYFQTFIEYVIRVRQYYDVVRKKYKYRELFPYQWSVCLVIIDSVFSKKGRKILPIQARQTGKSEAIKVWLPFITVFARQYVDFMHERFTSILGSYKNDTIEKLRKEVLPYFKIAIEVYNELYPDIELVSALDGKNTKLVNNSNRLQIDAKVDGQNLPYSECFFITLGTSQDSLTSHLTAIDESGKCDNDLFDNSISPFSNSTKGTQVFIGVPSTSPNSLLQKKFEARYNENSKIDCYFYDWKICYSLAKKVNSEQAEIMKESSLSEIAVTGGHHSITNRMNYYLEFSRTDGMFLTKDVIKQHDMFKISTSNFYEEEGYDTYRVAGIDISATSTGDYFVISRGTAWQDYYGIYRSTIRRMTTLNKSKEADLFTPTYKVNKICDILEEEMIDMCMIDSTSQQLHFVQLLRQTMNERGIKTMLVPLNYTNKSKQILFSTWEDSLYNGFTKFPNVKTCWETEKLYEEMQTLVKRETSTGYNYEAYRSKNDMQTRSNTDDHCNSVAMLHYCLQYLDLAIQNGEWFKDGSNYEWRADKFKVRDIIQYKEKEKSRNERIRIYLDLIP